MSPHIQLIVGLGNPGPRYQNNRHNVGIWFVESLAKQHSVNLTPEAKFSGRVGKLRIANHDSWLFIPTTYMNNSGQAVQAIANFYKIPSQAILVVHDELDFPPGTIKFKQDGGHGGHNGLRDIISHLHSQEFYRLRIGIGHPGDRDLVVDYVLSSPSRGDEDRILQSFARAESVLIEFLGGQTQKAMQKLHDEIK